MVRLAKHISVCSSLLLSVSLPTLAHAQIIGDGPAPVRAAIDDNGIDLARGGMRAQTKEISIGPDGPGGLVFTRTYSQGAGSSGFELTISNPSGSNWLASDGSRSYAFTKSGSTFTSTDGSGATLVLSGGIYTLTLSSGMTYAYGYSVAETGHPWVKARGTVVTYPTGEKRTLNWVDVTYCVDNLDGCPGGFITIVRLQGVSNSAGYQLHFNYHRSGIGPGKDAAGWMQLDSVTALNTAIDYCDPTAHSCSYSRSWPTVSFSGDPTTTYSVTDPEGHTTVYAHPTSLTYTVQRPTSGSVNTTYTFNSSGYVTSVVNDGKTWGYSYTPSTGTATMVVTDPASQTATITSDLTVGLPTSVQDALGHTTSYSYDTAGRLKRVTAHEGNYVEYSYDSRGNVTQTDYKDKAGTSTITTSAIYPSTCSNVLTCNQPTSTADARGNTTDYTYDSTHGGILTVTAPAPTTGATRPQTRYSYSALQAYYKNSGGSIVASGVNTYKLTAISQCQTGSGCAGTSDEVKTTIAYGSTGVANNLLPTSIATGAGDASLTAATAVAYDAIGNVLTVDGPLSGSADTTTYRYDLDRRRFGVISADPDGAGSLKRRAVKTTYNADDQPTVVEVGTVNGTSDSDWTAFSSAQQQTSTYDSGGYKTKDVVTASATTYQVVEYDYDAVGHLRCTAVRMNSAVWGTPLGSTCTGGTAGSYGPDRITKNTYDVVGRTTLVQTGYGVSGVQADEVATTYTNNGRVASVTDAEGNKTSYTYDGFDRLSKTSYPSTGKGAGTSSSTDYEELVYDANGNVTSRRLRGYAGDSTKHIDLTYDALNRLTYKDLPNSELDVSYAYDLLGRMTAAVDSASNYVGYAYDALSRRTAESSPLGAVGIGYDLAGQRTSLVWPDNFYVTYDRLVTGEVTAIRESGVTALATYAYDDLGRRTSLIYANGTVTNYAYDNLSRLASLGINLDGSTTTNDVSTYFGYSPASQVASQNRTNDLYFWDGHANLARGYTSNGLNQLTVSGNRTLSYDARGNLWKDQLTSTPTSGNEYLYGSQNELTTARTTASTPVTIATLAYDPLLRLYQMATPAPAATTTRFEYDGTDLIGEYDGSNVLQKRYVFGPGTDEPLVEYAGASTDPGVRTYMHADERGSIVARSNESGVKTAINSYDEYGIPYSANTGRFQYTGQAWLPELGLYNYKARMYSPTVGRFFQTDPIGYESGMNMYDYTGNDPTNGSDPSGLKTDKHVPPKPVNGNEPSTGTRLSGNNGIQNIASGGLGSLLTHGAGGHYVPGRSGSSGYDEGSGLYVSAGTPGYYIPGSPDSGYFSGGRGQSQDGGRDTRACYSENGMQFMCVTTHLTAEQARQVKEEVCHAAARELDGSLLTGTVELGNIVGKLLVLFEVHPTVRAGFLIVTGILTVNGVITRITYDCN